MGEVRYDFGGDVVVVTGAARGLGKDIALGFARPGGDRNELDATLGEIEAHLCGGGAAPGDVRRESAVGRMVAAKVERVGRLDALVGNARPTRAAHARNARLTPLRCGA